MHPKTMPGTSNYGGKPLQFKGYASAGNTIQFMNSHGVVIDFSKGGIIAFCAQLRVHPDRDYQIAPFVLVANALNIDRPCAKFSGVGRSRWAKLTKQLSL